MHLPARGPAASSVVWCVPLGTAVSLETGKVRPADSNLTGGGGQQLSPAASVSPPPIQIQCHEPARDDSAVHPPIQTQSSLAGPWKLHPPQPDWNPRAALSPFPDLRPYKVRRTIAGIMTEQGGGPTHGSPTLVSFICRTGGESPARNVRKRFESVRAATRPARNVRKR